MQLSFTVKLKLLLEENFLPSQRSSGPLMSVQLHIRLVEIFIVVQADSSARQRETMVLFAAAHVPIRKEVCHSFHHKLL